MQPETFETLYRAGLLTLDQEGNLLSAGLVFERAAALGPDQWEPLYAQAWCLLRLTGQPNGENSDQWAAAQGLLEAVVAMAGSKCPDAMAQLALIYSRGNRNEEAVELALGAAGRYFAVPSDPNPMPEQQWFDAVLVEGLCKLLDALDESPPHQSGLDTCERLEAGVKAVGMPQTIERPLIAEVIASRCELLQRLNLEAELEEARAQLASLAPNHPALARGAEASGSSKELRAVTALPTFASVGGIGITGTFQSRIEETFESFFGSGDLAAVRRRAEALGDHLMRTILMYGPSGCGKTFVVRSIAGEYRKRFNRDLTVLDVKLNEVMGKWVGESERAMSTLFDRAIKSQPCILFIDEVDSIGGSRDNGQDWRTMQTSHLLQEIDRIRQSNAMVLLIGATNRIWQVELALLRRFDRLIPVELPNRQVRREIFRAQLSEISEEFRPAEPDFDLLADRSHGLTPGDISSAMRRTKDRILGRANATGRMMSTDIARSLEEMGKPMHIRSWVRSAVEGLARADLTREAEELVERYAGFLDEPIATPSTPNYTPRSQPREAWLEEPFYDPQLIWYLRRLRQ